MAFTLLHISGLTAFNLNNEWKSVLTALMSLDFFLPCINLSIIEIDVSF